MYQVHYYIENVIDKLLILPIAYATHEIQKNTNTNIDHNSIPAVSDLSECPAGILSINYKMKLSKERSGKEENEMND